MIADPNVRERLLQYQRNEITEHHIYRRLAALQKDPANARVLEGIAADELRHYEQWKTHTGREAAPDRGKVWFYVLLARLLGATFAIKLMEHGEEGAQTNYSELKPHIPEATAIAGDENRHEDELIEMLDEERLQYMGSIVLGLNDALVELTGALAGLTLALQDTRLIALTGSITGIAAALSMAASEYLSTKTESTGQSPLKASLYTGAAYITTVVLLILPYLFLANYYLCLGLALAAAIAIIAFFNYYVSVARGMSFRKRFTEMAGLSLGVAALSFGIGFLVRQFLGVEV